MMKSAAAFGGVLLALLCAGTASAAPGWLPATTLGSGAKGNECPAQVALDAQGDATAAWTTAEGVQLATKPAAGGWQLATTIAFGSPACIQDVVSNQRGDSVAVWERFDGTRVRDEASVHPAGGSWSVPIVIEEGPKGSSEVMPARAALDLKGDVLVVYRQSGTGDIGGRFYEAGTGAWGFGFGITAPVKSNYGLGVAMDATGNAVVVWERVESGKETVEATYLPLYAFPVTPRTEAISAEAAEVPSNAPVVAMNGGGEAVAAFAHVGGGTTTIQATTMHPGGTWQLAETISVTGEAAQRPLLGLDPYGNVVALWEHPTGKETVIQATSRTVNAAWTLPVSISENGQTATSPALSVDGSGDAVAAWRSGAGTVVQSARRTAGGPWQSPATLSSPGASAPSVSLDARGDALAMWEVEGASREVQAAGYAANGPALGPVSIPTSGKVGETLTMTGAASDLWTTFTQTWSFGDGSEGTGGKVTHVYTAPGTYHVTYSATDTLFNAETASGTIVITSPTKPAVAPTVSSLRESHRRWRERGRASRRRPPIGTTFAFSLSEPASVTLTFAEQIPGRVVGHRCVALTRANRARHVCRRLLTRGTLTSRGNAGTNTVLFKGRVGHASLPPGTYVVTVAAVSAGLRSEPHQLTFTVAA